MVVMATNRAVEIELSDDERAQLEAWARRPTSAQALAQRSRIVLAAAQGAKNIVRHSGSSRVHSAYFRAQNMLFCRPVVNISAGEDGSLARPQGGPSVAQQLHAR